MRGDKVNAISKAPIFAGLSKRELGRVASIADEIDFRAGKTLIREGDRGREFFVLIDGEAKVTRRGRKLATLLKGDFFGEVALISKMPRTATVTTTSPTRALVITDRDFRALLKETPQIAIKVLDALAERLPSSDL